MALRCVLVVVLLCFLYVSGTVAGKSHNQAPEGPRRRVMKDCDWRYRHGNETAKAVCKKCVKEYDLHFPPRRSDVIQMREHCIPPLTPKEIGKLRCSYRLSKEEETKKCLSCLDDYDLPTNATKTEVREMIWKCLPHNDPNLMAKFACERRFEQDGNVTVCKECVDNNTISRDAGYLEYKALKKKCVPRRDPKKRLKLYCRWRYHNKTKEAQCEKCVDDFIIPDDYDYNNIIAVREKCMPRPTRKESLNKACERRYSDQVALAACKQCVELSNIGKDAPYEQFAEVRSKCIPRKSAKERLKEACDRRFSKEEDVTSCKACADSYEIGSNGVTTEIRAMFTKCLSQNRKDYRPKLLEECQKDLDEPNDVVNCQSCVRSYFYWIIPKNKVKEVKMRCFVRNAKGNRRRRRSAAGHAFINREGFPEE